MSSTTSLAPLSFYGSSNDPPPHEKELPLTPSIAVANALSTTTKSVKRLANTVHDGFRVEDFLAGLGTAVFVAPFVTTIDKSVVEAANGKAATISQGLKEGFGTLARNPLGYIRRKEFGFVVCVYTLTFWAANAAATYASKDENSISPESARFLSTIAVNIPGSVMQDRMFTRWFGLGRPRSVPKLTLGLWAVRDMTTCASSFSLPLMVSGATGVPLTATTLCLPVVTQFFSSPLHLLGLNLYNKPGISAGYVVRMLYVCMWERGTRGDKVHGSSSRAGGERFAMSTSYEICQRAMWGEMFAESGGVSPCRS